MNNRVLEFVSKPHASLDTHHEKPTINISTVLEELYILLEDYAPVWYTQDHHDRALRALLQRNP